MATTFKALKPEDRVLTRNILHEAIPITGTMVSSSTYADNNIKNFSHGMFQAVFDYPYLSSSANHIFDITLGTSNLSSSNGDFRSSLGVASQSGSKDNVYAEMAQVLCGHYADGAIRPFDVSGSLSSTTDANKMKEVYFINFARLLTKDEIKKGTFEIKLGTGASYADPFQNVIKLLDSGSASNYKVNSPAGEFGLLYAETVTEASAPYNNAVKSTLAAGQTTARPVGLVFYQAGIAVLTSSVFYDHDATSVDGAILNDTNVFLGNGTTPGVHQGKAQFIDVAISGNCDNLRHRIQNISFNNTTELNSTVYFCRANAHEFNYSSNPTYLSGSEIRVRPANNADAEPVSYVTTVGLYGPNNEMLAVAKTSEPLKKSPSNELTLRVRLDY